MRIQHNIAALNAHRQLGTNNGQVSKNLEKLSSGYRINRAADDAAGLAISEKMRGQIRGLDQAKANASDGISLIQTAEGGLNETHSILQRMRELAVQNTNGTYQDAEDRANADKEFTALKNEIDRIANTTKFNKIGLLAGTTGGTVKAGGKAAASSVTSAFTAGTAPTTPAAAGTITVALGKLGMGAGKTLDIGDKKGLAADDNTALGNALAGKDFTIDGKTYTAAISGSDLVLTDKAPGASTITAATVAGEIKTDAGGTPTPLGASDVTAANGTDAVGGTKAKVEFTTKDGATSAGTTLKVGDKTFEFLTTGTAAAGNIGVTIGAGDTAEQVAGKLETALKAAAIPGWDAAGATTTGAKITMNASAAGVGTDPTVGGGTGTGGGNTQIQFQIGANGASAGEERVTLALQDMRAAALGVDGLSISNEANSLAAIDSVDAAINTVSGFRADLGALQNRLEHTVNNLGTTSENLAAAESRIRDVDMAKEMMEMTKNNILTQAAQSMLAQANTMPQGVLQLLQ